MFCKDLVIVMDAGYIYDNNELLLEEGIDLSKEKQITRELIDKVNKVNYCHGFECVVPNGTPHTCFCYQKFCGSCIKLAQFGTF